MCVATSFSHTRIQNTKSPACWHTPYAAGAQCGCVAYSGWHCWLPSIGSPCTASRARQRQRLPRKRWRGNRCYTLSTNMMTPRMAASSQMACDVGPYPAAWQAQKLYHMAVEGKASETQQLLAEGVPPDAHLYPKVSIIYPSPPSAPAGHLRPMRAAEDPCSAEGWPGCGQHSSD